MKLSFIFITVIGLSLMGCGSNYTTATLTSDNLIASSNQDFIKVAFTHKLTPNDLQRLKRNYPKTLEKIEKYQNLTIQDVINLTKAGVADDVISYEIRVTRSAFFLTPEDERELQQAGVSRKVIRAMKDTVDDRY